MITRAAAVGMALAMVAAAGCASKPSSSAAKPQPMASGNPAPKASLQGTPYDKPGFATRTADGRLWVFKAGAKEIAEFDKHGELVKQVIRPGAGPDGMTIKAPDSETITAYLCAKQGFVTRVVDGRLWVFKEGSKEIEEFDKHGELVKQVIRPGAGPGGITIKAADTETISAYLAVK
jgi:sugar lactone lactonase YvrE